VIWIVTLFPFYINYIIIPLSGTNPGQMVLVDGVETFPLVRQGIAFVHTGFNLTNTLMFMPFVPLLAKIVTKVIPEKNKEIPHLTYLDSRMISSPEMGIQQSHTEVSKMGDHVDRMFSYLGNIIENPNNNNEKRKRKLFHREEILDIVQKEITEYLGRLLSENISIEVTEKARMQLRMADEYESISDYIATILKLYIKKQKAEVVFTEEGQSELLALNEKIWEYIKIINTGMKENIPETLTKARTLGESFSYAIKESRKKHLERLGNGEVAPLQGLIFTDLLTAYRRVKDHGLNIAEAVAGEK